MGGINRKQFVLDMMKMWERNRNAMSRFLFKDDLCSLGALLLNFWISTGVMNKTESFFEKGRLIEFPLQRSSL